MVGTPAFVYDLLRGCHDRPAPDTGTRASAVRTIVSVLGASPSPAPPSSAGSPSSAVSGVVGAVPGTYWQWADAAPASPGLAADPGIPSRSPVHTISNGPPTPPPPEEPPPDTPDPPDTAGTAGPPPPAAEPPPEPPTTDDDGRSPSDTFTCRWVALSSSADPSPSVACRTESRVGSSASAGRARDTIARETTTAHTAALNTPLADSVCICCPPVNDSPFIFLPLDTELDDRVIPAPTFVPFA